MRKSQARGQIECFHASRMGVLLGSNLLADSVGCICPTSGRRAAHACPWQAEPEALHLPIRRRWLKDTWWVLRERRVVAQTDGGGRWRTRLAAGTGAHHNCRRGVPPCSQFNCSFTFPRFRCVGLRSARALGDDQAPHPSLSPHFALQPRRASASERLRPCPLQEPASPTPAVAAPLLLLAPPLCCGRLARSLVHNGIHQGPVLRHLAADAGRRPGCARRPGFADGGEACLQARAGPCLQAMLAPAMSPPANCSGSLISRPGAPALSPQGYDNPTAPFHKFEPYRLSWTVW